MSPLISTLPLLLKKPKISSLFLFNGDKLSHRLPAFGDDDGLALGLDFIHDGEAAGFEDAGRDGPGFHELVTMVITPWSSDRS